MGAETTAATPLTPEEAVELIKQGRVPIVSRSTTGHGNEQREEMMAFIPPEGTQFGDVMEGRPATGYTFKSPEGEVRGVAALQFLPLREGLKVRRQIEEALRDEGIDTSSQTAYALRRARRWISENLGL